MEIIINGEQKEFQEGSSVADVIKKLGLEGKVMAAACNMEIVKQDKWSEKILKNGDKLELLDFVGGG
jgi:sulfur carrier protein